MKVVRPQQREIGRRHIPPSRKHWGHPERSAGGKAGGAQSRDRAPLSRRDLPSDTGDFWIYILTNTRCTVLYIGMSNDLLKRVSEHRLAENSSFTRRYRVDTLIARMNPAWQDLGALLLADDSRMAPGPSTALRPPFRLRFARDDREAMPDLP
jgi:hypothetical protein